ncbi:AAA domain-containing protein [Nocardiopsis sp. L17-MgMaSL7]|uniref:caspase, EACC1-associated type n=1 Tax=Nocardiopsis sp. L17-MgMaSL7 TaxID=1938893 RepID=UPI000D70C539|nr:AAA domain-containing protein [Nocardiopsis sp. L17-MgMaSL7]PWV54853.1 caspase domain-containing protein [Nocardiopsis sp. L17-MgMaSL7]
MRRTAILIGVNRYDDLAPLDSPHEDVRAIERVLKSNGHYDRVQPLLDPTRNEAMEALETALSEGKPDDLLLVSFSGHGVKDKRGRLHLALRDTRRKRLETTALSAEVLKRLLEDSRMRSKVLLLDCCHGGAFADGFATRSAGGEEAEPLDLERQLSDGAGTYVIAASGALELAREGDNSAGARPSPFSASVVRGLAGAATDSNGDGWIDAVDLYQHVHREVDHVEGQRVTVSSLGVRGSLVLARHTGSATAADLPKAQAGTGEQGSAAEEGAKAPAGEAGRGGHRAGGVWGWGPYLDYLRDCLMKQSVLQQLPDASGRDVAVCEMGSEVLLSRAADRWRLAGRAEGLAREAVDEGRHLRYGYPAVLFDPVRSERGRGRKAKLAPLFVMDVEVEEEDGERFLVPVGEPELNRELLVSAADLDEGDIEELVTWFEVDWDGGGVSGLADKARTVCVKLDLTRVDDLIAGELRTALDVRHGARRGAQNAAVLYRADPAGAAVKQLLGDLDRSGGGIRLETIDRTALAALSGPPSAAGGGEPVLPVVTGRSNTAQEEILASAMGRVLTVATGAPGTGKSELITSVVTTAVAAGQSVLVASTNNTAVDEVVTRVNKLAPDADLMVRTGNQERRARESEILNALMAAEWGAADAATAHARLVVHQRGLDAGRHELAEAERTERRLALLAGERNRLRRSLPRAVDPSAFERPRDRNRWTRRVEASLESRWTGWWHRWLTRRGLGIPGTDQELSGVLAYLTTENEWWELRGRAERGTSPEQTVARMRGLSEQRREGSTEYLLGRVADSLRRGRGVVEARLRNLASGQNGWKGMKALVRTVPAWATTSRSVRGVFPPEPGLFDLVVIDEASQCTVADLVPLLYRSRRALVIGDPYQLQPVNPMTTQDDRRILSVHGLPAAETEERSLSFGGSSAYHAAASALVAGGGEVLWLDEHYRCHPDIVAPVNRRFYGERLAVRTNSAALVAPGDPAVQWIDVRGACERPGGRSCRNREEAESVLDLLRKLGRSLPPEASIGVVSPFAPQVRLIEDKLGEGAADRIRVGTAHRFQGGECDVVVVSTAAAAGVHRSSGNWARQQQNLWNVAVTRARSRLYVVGDREYWAEQGGLLGDLAAQDEVSGVGALDEAGSLLFEALTVRGRAPRVSHRVEGYSCDLLVPGEHKDTAVIVDRAGVGSTAAPAPGRTLQRVLDRAALFEEVSGARTVRVPAWRCLVEPETVAGELIGG